jgi:uncharacterized protein YbjQ (UPF0145 family)
MKLLSILALVGLFLVSQNAFSRDSVQGFSITDALAHEKAQSLLGDQVEFYFGDERPSGVSREFGEFKTNKKTNAFGKSDKVACQWAFLSAMVALRDRALNEGGNAVVNIRSNYKSNLTSSPSEFRCGAGAMVAGVALVGTVVTITK